MKIFNYKYSMTHPALVQYSSISYCAFHFHDSQK